MKTLRKKYLGIDYQNNEYYYFLSGENKIYIKNRKKEEWAYYENKDDIQILINKLTEKGKNEKKLKMILKFFLSQMKEKEEKEKQEKEAQENNNINNENKNNEEIKKNENNNNVNANNDYNINKDIDTSKLKIDLSKKKSESEKKKINKKHHNKKK